MGIWSNLKTWLECKRSGRIEEYQEYKKVLEIMKNDIARFEQYIISANKRIDDLRERGYAEDSKEMREARDELHRWEYCLDEAKLEIQFIRPNFQEDIEYRDHNTGTKFIEALKEAKSPELNLVFHGTPIYFAKEIIRTGKISSSADRYDGYIKSTDTSGEISVSDMDSLSRTLNFFSGMVSYMHCLPAGCVLAMFPKDDNDFNKKQSTMSNVDFRQNPEQLYGIFTTPENIPNIQRWLNEVGLNPNLVYDFEGFIEAVKKTSKGLNGNKFKNTCGVSQEVVQAVEQLSHGSTPANAQVQDTLELEGSREDNQ